MKEGRSVSRDGRSPILTPHLTVLRFLKKKLFNRGFSPRPVYHNPSISNQFLVIFQAPSTGQQPFHSGLENVPRYKTMRKLSWNILRRTRVKGSTYHQQRVCLSKNSVSSSHEIFESLYQFIESLNKLTKLISNFGKLIHTFIVHVISILLGNNFNFIHFYSSILIKSKTEPRLSALREINNGLTC